MAWSGSVNRPAGISIRNGLSSARVMRLKTAATVGFNTGGSLTLATVTIVVAKALAPLRSVAWICRARCPTWVLVGASLRMPVVASMLNQAGEPPRELLTSFTA